MGPPLQVVGHGGGHIGPPLQVIDHAGGHGGGHMGPPLHVVLGYGVKVLARANGL